MKTPPPPFRARRRGLAASVLLALTLLAAPAVAGDTERRGGDDSDIVAEAPCGVPTALLRHNPPLAASGRALDRRRLQVVVWGTRSSTAAGTSGADQAYPNHLRDRLAERYPEADIRVELVSQPGLTAAQMLRGIGAVQALKPDLVIWQTGSTDAARGVPLQEFGRAVARGLATLRARGADVMLMDMQYGPYAELLTNSKPYRGYLWWVSREENVGLLPRYQVMEHWSEQGRFDLATDDRARQRANADAIHACLGDLLGWMIVDAVERARP